MTELPLSLGVRRKSDTKAVAASRQPSKAQQEKALQRDDYTCRCCGFRSLQFQRVLPVEGESATVCFFCEQCLTLDVTGLAGLGTLIWLPEISQTDLNHLLRAIYVAKASDHSLAEPAQRALDALLSRRTEAKKRLGTDDPLILATVFHENLTDAEYKARDEKLTGIRLLSYDKRLFSSRTGDVDVFSRIVKYWTSPEGPFSKIPVEKWESLFKAVVGA